MNGLETAGVFFCIIICTIFIWTIGYAIFRAESDDNYRLLGASIVTIVLLIIALTMITINCIASERKNDEYEKVISKYEEKEVGNENNH